MEESYQNRGTVQPQSQQLQMMGLPNRCAGCSAVDVALLACDDIDGSGNVTDPSQRARYVWIIETDISCSCEMNL